MGLLLTTALPTYLTLPLGMFFGTSTGTNLSWHRGFTGDISCIRCGAWLGCGGVPGHWSRGVNSNQLVRITIGVGVVWRLDVLSSRSLSWRAQCRICMWGGSRHVDLWSGTVWCLSIEIFQNGGTSYSFLCLIEPIDCVVLIGPVDCVCIRKWIQESGIHMPSWTEVLTGMPFQPACKCKPKTKSFQSRSGPPSSDPHTAGVPETSAPSLHRNSPVTSPPSLLRRSIQFQSTSL